MLKNLLLYNKTKTLKEKVMILKKKLTQIKKIKIKSKSSLKTFLISLHSILHYLTSKVQIILTYFFLLIKRILLLTTDFHVFKTNS